MTESPVEFWRTLYPFEEPIGDEIETLRLLRARLDHKAQIEAHIGSLETELLKLPGELQDTYGWCRIPDNFDYASEAYYQLRSMRILANLERTPFRERIAPVKICARQLLRPSAFNGTPRVKRSNGWSYIIFPAPTVYWMYEFMGMICAVIDGRSIIKDKIKEYLVYLISVRVFENAASPITAYAIDFMVDEIAKKVLPSLGQVDQTAVHEATPLSVSIVYCIEEFIILHECAHEILAHPSTGSSLNEADADNLAIEMLLAMGQSVHSHRTASSVDPADVPWVGYLALNLWSVLRLAAELRIVSRIAVDADDAGIRRDRVLKLFDERISRLRGSAYAGSIPSSPLLKTLKDATDGVVAAICECEISDAEVARIREFSEMLARSDFVAGSTDLFSDAREERNRQASA
jgi:hypothetical protein